MKKTVDRFLRGIGVLGLSMVGMMLLAAVVALRHIMETPQPLESPLPGEAHIYRWKRGHIFYKALGQQEAPPLVLLHAPNIGASSYEMRHLMEPLAKQFRVYAPDLPGFGLSDRPRIDYAAETYITVLQDFLRDVVGQPAMLVANGLSNNYAVASAQRSPELCARLVLISPSTLFHSELGQAFLPRLMQAPFIGTLLYPVISTHLALRYRAARQHSTSDIDYLYAASHQFGAEHAPLALMAGKLNLDVSAQFAHLQQPVLMIWGPQALNNLRALTEQHTVPAHVHMELVKDAGVAVHEERPANVIKHILEWSAAEKLTAKPEPEVAAQTEKPEPEIEAQAEPLSTEENAAAAHLKLSAHADASTAVERETVAAAEVSLLAEVASVQPSEQVAQTQPEAPEQAQQPVRVVVAYCVKCKQKTSMQNIEEVTTKNGSPAIRGNCSVCGAGQYRMGRLT